MLPPFLNLIFVAYITLSLCIIINLLKYYIFITGQPKIIEKGIVTTEIQGVNILYNSHFSLFASIADSVVYIYMDILYLPPLLVDISELK